MNPSPATPREIFSWAMYDFANSGYTTVVLTAVFNAYFVNALAGGAPWAAFAWTFTLSISYALVMVLGPLMGARADVYACKKRYLGWTTAACVLATALLATVGPSGLVWAGVLVIVSNVCYSLGENLCAGFLPELATGDRIAKVSSWGWSVGYLGGLLALGISLYLVTTLKAAGWTAQAYVGASMVAVAILYGLAALPLFMFVQERAVPKGEPPRFAGLITQTLESVRAVRGYPELNRFMLCGLLSQAGVAVVITLAAVYAEAALGFKTEDTITMLIVVNVTAALGAFIFGWAQDRMGHRRTLLLTFALWIVAIVVLASKTDRIGFWIAANCAGAALGACQSGGRALVGYLAPPAQVAEFYGVWGLYTRLSAIIGPLTYGAITWATGGNHRAAMLFTGVFFVAAIAVLLGVNVERGRARVA
jgi:MFS transporter, UMF1 family